MDQTGCGRDIDLAGEPRVTIWNEYRHEKSDENVARIYPEGIHGALAAMRLIVLHSGHSSKIFKTRMGTTCDLKWLHDDTERLWVVAPGHPIAEGRGEYIELEEEMYGEPFDVPQPDELVFVSWFGGGEIFRSGLCYRRGRRRGFFFP